MNKKKNKILMFLSSLFPGAGQMYMGFMKRGLSIMSIFFLIIYISELLHSYEVLFALPVVWCYSFFDFVNKQSLDEESLSKIKDKYILSFQELVDLNDILGQRRNFILGIIVLLMGAYLFLNNIVDIFEPYLGSSFYRFVHSILREMPTLIVGALFVCVGLRLVKGKKMGREINEPRS